MKEVDVKTQQVSLETIPANPIGVLSLRAMRRLLWQLQ